MSKESEQLRYLYLAKKLHGREFSLVGARSRSELLRGKISCEHPLILPRDEDYSHPCSCPFLHELYLCTDELDGQGTDERFGYRYSWTLIIALRTGAVNYYGDLPPYLVENHEYPLISIDGQSIAEYFKQQITLYDLL